MNQGNPNDRSLTSLTGNTPAALLREKSSADLTQAIHSPGDEAYALDRARTVLSLYYEPDMTAEARAEMLEEFRKALRPYPKWTVARAFDDWVRQHKRRPSPGEIAILAKGHIKPLTDELERRTPPEEPIRSVIDKDSASEILKRAGFTPRRFKAMQANRMATTFDEAETTAKPSKLMTYETDPERLAEARRKAGVL